ncbi:polyphosphate kinase 2 [Sulfurovum sp.]|uniref:polyphosphate kinase 2 n=1 Tax=Sulfurovum sp. TaxID=1969726 RepID=UPI002867B3BB|nr:polyphosphate kinase 2 [Sulfurovum sp.]
MSKKIKNKEYEKELYKLQVELCELQRWVKQEGKRIVIVFEGRDTAGKGGVIKRILERVSPRVFQINALPKPSDRQKTQMYIQRYMERFPAAGEIAIFDRSWYNRAGVERVMGFCTEAEYYQFLKRTPVIEQAMIDDGIILIKYWFDVSQEVQFERLQKRIEDPRKHWKISPMDLQAQELWDKYTEAKDKMFEATDTEHAPWFVVNSDNKKSARLNCISHLLSQIPYEKIPFIKPDLEKSGNSKYTPVEYNYNVVPEKY